VSQLVRELPPGRAQYDDLLNFETPARLGEREKAALAYAEAITWRLDPADALGEQLQRHFSEPDWSNWAAS
jgi:alkylhydroperoxidase family enzyme